MVKSALIGLLAFFGCLWVHDARAQCVDCIAFDTCVAAGANGWLRCRFGNGYCIAQGYCAGARVAPDAEETPRDGYRNARVLDVDYSFDQTWCDDMPSRRLAPALFRVSAAPSSKSRLSASSSMLIQLAQISAPAAHVAWALADQRGWSLAEMSVGALRLRNYSAADVMRLVSGQPVWASDESVGSTPPIYVSGTTVSADSFAVRVYEAKSVDLVLVYRRIAGSADFALQSWQ